MVKLIINEIWFKYQVVSIFNPIENEKVMSIIVIVDVKFSRQQYWWYGQVGVLQESNLKYKIDLSTA